MTTSTYLPEAQAPSLADVRAQPGVLLLEFGTDWCGHCQAAQPAIAQALHQAPPLVHIKVEDGRGRALGRAFAVKLWPTLVLLRDGQELARVVRPATAEAVLRLWAAAAS